MELSRSRSHPVFVDPSSSGLPGNRFFRKNVKVPKARLAVYSRQLATLLKAGVPIVHALKVMLKQERKGPVFRIIQSQISELESGNPYSSTLKAFPSVFDQMYLHLVISGEKAGVLSSVMDRLAHYLERSVQTKGKIKSAMTYPVVVFCASILIVSGLLIFVVPQFEDIFNSMLQGAAMPAMTRWVLGASRFFQGNWYWIIAGLGILFFGFRMLIKLPVFRLLYDRSKLFLPLFGIIIKKSLLARFCRTFGTLLESAVPILDAIETSSRTLDNRVLESIFLRAKSKVRDGQSVALSLEMEKQLPPVLVGMIEVGEATGELPSMLIQISDTYEREVEVGVNGLTTLIEPLMILGLAIVIGFLVIALFLPIVEIMQHLAN